MILFINLELILLCTASVQCYRPLVLKECVTEYNFLISQPKDMRQFFSASTTKNFCLSKNMQGFSLASAIGHSPKIVPNVRESETIFRSAYCTVMHSNAIVFLFYKTIADWPNFCKRQAGSHNFTPKILIH